MPQKVLEARVGRDRIFSEAVESHIGGWFWNAAADASIRPVAQPELNYELPTASEDEPFGFTAEFAVQAPPEELPTGRARVPRPEADVPEELVDSELEVLRPLGRRARAGRDPAGEGRRRPDRRPRRLHRQAQRDYVASSERVGSSRRSSAACAG